MHLKSFVLDIKKIVVGGIAAGIAIFIVSFIVDYIIDMFLHYDIFSLGGMKAKEDPMMMLFFLSPIVMGFAMSTAFQKFKDSFKSKGVCRGKAFGIYVWLLAGLPSAFIVYTTMNYPIGFTYSNVLGSLLYMIAAGIVLEKVSG